MPGLEAIVRGVLVPALVAGAIFLAGSRLPRFSGGAVAVGLGYAAGHALYFEWPALPPLDAFDWLPWVALVAAACGLAEPWLLRTAPRLAPLARLVAPGLVPWLFLQAGESPGVGGTIVLAVTLWAFTISTEALAARRPGATMPLALWCSAAGACGVLLLSGSLKLAQMAAIVTACMGAALVLAWCRLLRPLAAGAAGAVTALLTAIVLSGCVYDVPLLAGCLVLAAPSAAWIGEAPAVRRLEPWKAVLARLFMTLLPAAAALALAWQASPSFE